MGRTVLAVDIGGTKTAVGIARGGCLVGVTRFATARHPDPSALVDAITHAGDALAAKHDVSPAAVAVGVPGTIDRDTGAVLSAANLPFRHFPLASELSRGLGGLPVLLEDDANCAVIGEATAGAARGYADIAYLTVSTGIGMGAITAGQLVRGAHGSAGEIGHVQVVPDGERCGCGALGCLEAYASGPALARLGRQLVESGAVTLLPALAADPSRITAADVAAAAEAADPACQEIVRAVADRLAFAVHLMTRLLDPGVVVLGGGVMGSRLVAQLVMQACSSASAPSPSRRVHVVLSALGGDAVLVGAAELWACDGDLSRLAGGLT